MHVLQVGFLGTQTEVEVCVQEGYWEFSWDQYFWENADSIIGQREK